MSAAHRPQVVLIAAMGKGRVIGVANRLPWHLPSDLKHFRELTRGHSVVMGRKTFDSIGKPLPQRLNVVISRTPERVPAQEGVVASAKSLAEALALAQSWASARGLSRVYLIGGSEIYRQALEQDLVDAIELTEVDWTGAGDAYLPEFPEGRFVEIARGGPSPDAAADEPASRWLTLARK